MSNVVLFQRVVILCRTDVASLGSAVRSTRKVKVLSTLSSRSYYCVLNKIPV